MTESASIFMVNLQGRIRSQHDNRTVFWVGYRRRRDRCGAAADGGGVEDESNKS